MHTYSHNPNSSPNQKLLSNLAGTNSTCSA